MKVALIFCPYWDADWALSSLALLSAQLKRHGHDTRVFDFNNKLQRASSKEGDYKTFATSDTVWNDTDYIRDTIGPSLHEPINRFIEELLADDVRVVGFSIQFSNLAMSLFLARLIKERDPGITVVCGGSYCLREEHCKMLVREDAVDAVFFGEADLSFPAWVDAFEKTGKLARLPGVLLEEDTGSLSWNPPRPEILDEMPHADYSVFGGLEGYRGKVVHTCRGCVRRCDFCLEWRDMPYRRMSAQRIFREFEYQLEQDPEVNKFMFGDSLVNGDMKSLLGFCDAVIASGMEIKWTGYAIVREEMTDAALRRMYGAGCRVLMYGVESGSPQVQRDMNKNVSPELNGRVLQATQDAGIESVMTFIVGYPTETEKEFAESLQFVETYAKGIGVLAPSLFTLTGLDDMAQRYALEYRDHATFWRTKDDSNTYPLRLKRLKRLFETAQQHGCNIRLEGKLDADQMERYMSRMLGKYEDWLARAA